MRIENVFLPTRGEDCRWDVELTDGIIQTILPSIVPFRVHTEPDATPGILLPALCHPHVHLDKPYILTCNHGPAPNHPNYSDLVPISGTFGEALTNTSKAKGRYTADDLYLRGSQLLATSYRQGVASLRAFVELDHVTGTLALTTAIRLKRDFSHLLEVQICAFAQDPIFSTEHGEKNRSILDAALSEYSASISALGTTPYVEQSREASLENIQWAIATALKHNLHLDFHLDYNLEAPATSAPLTYSVIELLKQHQWSTNAEKSKTIVLGHCTQLTVLSNAELACLAKTIKLSRLPIHFVGLPSSDLLMMGRPSSDLDAPPSQTRPRATLQVPSMIRELGLSACIGVNNVGNAFTPYGTGDPLQLASLGVGLYQAGTTADARTLYACVSWRARHAIGLEDSREDGHVAEGCKWQPMLLIENDRIITLPSEAGSKLKVPARLRIGFRDVVWDPPETRLRSIIA
jgi:cytosine/adenosine deaminase-related metal-dependent hydrolase